MVISNRIEDLWRKIPANVKAGFFASLLAGLITHLVGIANFFQNHDSLAAIFSNATSRIYYGRWLQNVIQIIFGGKVVDPGTFFVMGIVCVAFTAAITVHLLSIRSVPLAALTGVLMVTFPSVVSTFAYSAAAVFMCALLFACLGVFWTRKGNRWIPLAVVSLVISLAIYQTYICYATGLFVLCLIFDIFDKKPSPGQVIAAGVKYVAIILGSILLYYAITQILLNRSGRELVGYDANFMSNIVGNIFYAYKKVVRFFWLDAYGENTVFTKWLYRGIVLCGLTEYIILMLHTGCCKNAGNVILSVSLMLIFPLALHVISVLRVGANSHWVMIYSFILVPVMTITFTDRVESFAAKEPWKKPWNGAVIFLTGGGMLLSAVMGYVWFVVSGECYTSMRLVNYAAYESASEVWNDMRDQGWEKDMPVAFVGDKMVPFRTDKSVVQKSLDKSQYTGIGNEFFNWDHAHMTAYLRSVMGRDFDVASAVQIEELSSRIEVVDMPVYPEDGSIQIVDGVMVVKLSELTVDLVKETSEDEICGDTDIVYGGQGQQLVIESPDDFYYAGEDVYSFTEANTAYSLHCDEVDLIEGDAEAVDVILYQLSTKTVLAQKTFDIGEGFCWNFETSDYVSSDGGRNFNLLIYAGNMGYTAGNTIAYNGLTLEKVTK